MNIKDSVFELIQKDYSLREKIVKQLGGRETAVYQWGFRKMHSKVSNYIVVNIIKEHAGLTDDQIFEKTEEVKI